MPRALTLLTVFPNDADSEIVEPFDHGPSPSCLPGNPDRVFGIVPDQPALTAIFFSAFRASAFFGRVTASTPFLKLVLILSVSMTSGT